MPDIQCDPNVIFGPVVPARGWPRSGWGFEVYTRIDGKVGSFIPRVHRSRNAAIRARRKTIKLDRWYNETCNAGRSAIHDCASDAQLLATIRRVWAPHSVPMHGGNV
jgi:hypothetical protein